MLQDDLALEQCLQQLVVEGKRHGGYISIQMVIEALYDKQQNLSVEALEWVYERLAAEGIELVDQLPSTPSANKQVNEGSDRRHRRKVKAAQRKQRDYDFVKSLDEAGFALCLEEAIDELLVRAETGVLRGKDFFTFINKFRPSAFEVVQLVEYLLSKGIDVPGVDLFQFYRSITEDSETCDEELEDFLTDTLVKCYRKKNGIKATRLGG